ncbi:hypothetical protein [Kitasatospora griseola]|uniref:hypothetical protein n=1 Tax=Kitasatospora griseola TaxID=2064 RepID=UPI00166F6A94|nr:hypothetical protein [Kitasatospora griseola]GGR07699.1 hypothetical protein GCM10010195_73220 [Kitasatospora griseola]
MRSRTLRTVLAAATVAAALAMSGCSSSDSAPRVEGGGTGKTKPQDDGAVRQAWVNCMHQEGQNGVELDKDGNILIPATGTDGGSTADYDTAARTCDAKVPGIHQVKPMNMEKSVEEARAFVACARKNGYPDLPDPDPRTAILTIPRASFDMAKWDAIQPACGRLPMPGYNIGQ